MIITKEYLENYLFTEIDDSFDPYLEGLIQSAQDYIEKYINRKLIKEQTISARYFDGNNLNKITIDDCSDIEEVYIDDILNTEFLGYPYNTNAYTSIRLKNGNFNYGTANITVKAKWGVFPEDEIPADIKLACAMLLSNMLNANNNTATGKEVKSETIGRYSVSYISSIEREKLLPVNALLDKYRKIGL